MTEFMGITLDEKFWVLIAFIIFVLVVGKKATKATNEALDARSNAIQDKINISENTLTEAQNLLKDSQEALVNHKSKALEQVAKQKQHAIDNAKLYLENIKKEIDRKNISADKEIEYMHIEAVNNIKNKITDITLRSVEEVAVTEFNNDKSKNIFDEFVKNIPSALTSTK